MVRARIGVLGLSVLVATAIVVVSPESFSVRAPDLMCQS